MSITEINTFRSLNNRNKLRQQSFKNKHTFKEEIYIDVDNFCLVINVVIGGRENGIEYYKYVYENDCFFKELNELYSELLKEYGRLKNNIDPDLTFKLQSKMSKKNE